MRSPRANAASIAFVVRAALALLNTAAAGIAAEAPSPSRFQVSSGFVVETIASPPLVKYPLFAAQDDRGRLFVAEGTGTNLPGAELVKKKLGRILLLEDTNADGIFDTSKVFVDGLVFPQGVLWHDGALYVASHPSIWRFEDKDDDGKADRQEALVGRFEFNGNGCDIHGPFLGPDGRLYWTDGRHGYEVKTKDGAILKGLASRVWRCKPDGSEIERLCGGGFDNPVELAFTPAGDLIGTMDQGTGDALLHYVEGGVYPMQHSCVQEFAATGPLLEAINQYTAALPVALCGLVQYRSKQLGDEYQGSLFTAQFNVHRIERHVLTRLGATYRSKNSDFLTSQDYDVHLSDILEDADGSLLFVDMGAWFNFGCPTSKIAKPPVLGAIYRIRRLNAPKVPDPWGRALEIGKRSPADLVALLDHEQPKVRDQAVARLAKIGSTAVPALAEAATKSEQSRESRSVEARRNAVWALCRIGTSEAQTAIRKSLTDADASVRQAAVHSVGVLNDRQSAELLVPIAIDDEPQLRLKAVEALGRFGQPQAVPTILESLRHGTTDRHLEHALIYALIRINQRGPTLGGLSDANPRVRQAALIALDQMPAGQLTQEHVAPLLDTDDAELQKTVLDCISRHEGWSNHTLELLRQWLGGDVVSAAQEQSLTGSLLAFCTDEKVQTLVTSAMANPRTSASMRLLLLRVLARCGLESLPEPWRLAVGDALRHDDPAVRKEAIITLKACGLDQFDAVLADLSRQDNLPAEVRIAALDCIAGRRHELDIGGFVLLNKHLNEDVEPLLRVAAARTLGGSRLDHGQLMQLAGKLASAGPIDLPLLISAFTKDKNVEVGRALVKSLELSSGTSSLSTDDLDGLFKSYPDEIQQLAQPLRDRLAVRQREQAAYLGELMLALLQSPGNADRGREIFFAKKVGCYSCHTTAGKGGAIGPDLSQVGRFRTSRDLLEAIVYPSSTIVPQFRTYAVSTNDGRITNGMIVRDTSEAVYLRTAGQLAEVRIANKDIDALAPSQVSIMPAGLEKTMTRQELSDLLEFLSHQKLPEPHP